MFSYFAAYAVTYTDIESFDDGCNNKIVLRVTRDITLNQQECREFKCAISIDILQGSQFVLNYQKMSWETGSFFTEIYTLSDIATFYFDYGQSIQNIVFKFDVKTVCGTFSFDYNNLVTVINGDCYASCSSSFSYCDFYYQSGNEMPELIGFQYFDANNTVHYINSNNNPGGIFNFPYYCHVAVQCNFPPTIYDFERDLNEFLDLGNSIPVYGELYGTAMWMHSYGQGNPVDLCKLNLRIKNSKIFIYDLDFEIYEFDKPNCSIGDFILNNPVGIYSSFPPTYDCFNGNLAPENMENSSSSLNFNFEKLFSTDVNHRYVVYPTITDNRITIDFKKEQLSGKDIELYSVSGNLIKHTEVHPNIYSFTVGMSEVEAGVYLLKIIDKENGEYTVEKIIKQ